MAGKGKPGPVPVCVGCETRTADCRRSQVGMVCGRCAVELRAVLGIQDKLRRRKPTDFPPILLNVQRGNG